MHYFHRFYFTLLMAGLLAIVSLTASRAGEFASRKILGFSVGGGQFAYEEYGIQDGSGFPFSNIYILDTATNEMVGGSPFRVRLSYNATLADARAQSRKMAKSALKNITEPGFVAATNRYSERPAEPHRLVASPTRLNDYDPPLITLEIEEYDVKGGDVYCQTNGTVTAYNLYLLPRSEGGQKTLLHTDGNSIADQRRGCVYSYGFADLVTYPYASAKPPTFVGVALIRYVRRGFEGPDGYFTAVGFDALQ